MHQKALIKLKIACFSAICVDYFAQHNVYKAGGNSLNLAVNAKRLGTGKVSVAGFIGNDKSGELVLELLKEEMIDITYLKVLKGKTASNIIYNRADGERYSKIGDWENGVKNKGRFSEKAWAYFMHHDVIAIPYLDRNLDLLLRRKPYKPLITVDFLHYDDPELLAAYIKHIDIAFTSSSPEKTFELGKLVKTSDTILVAMLGSHGSQAFTKKNKYVQPAFQTEKIIDTTGCGDAYQAGFICSYAMNGNIREAMFKGTDLATRVLRRVGAV